jgi:hypothetical protein
MQPRVILAIAFGIAAAVFAPLVHGSELRSQANDCPRRAFVNPEPCFDPVYEEPEGNPLSEPDLLLLNVINPYDRPLDEVVVELDFDERVTFAPPGPERWDVDSATWRIGSMEATEILATPLRWQAPAGTCVRFRPVATLRYAGSNDVIVTSEHAMAVGACTSAAPVVGGGDGSAPARSLFLWSLLGVALVLFGIASLSAGQVVDADRRA